MRNLFLIILITLGSVLVNAQNLVLPLYGKAEFEKIASLDDEMPELHVYLRINRVVKQSWFVPVVDTRDSLSARRESLWQNG